MTMSKTTHNPDQLMSDLRQLLSLGRKKIGILLGAGAPASICVNAAGEIVDTGGNPLIPTVVPLTKQVVDALEKKSRGIVDEIIGDLGGTPNIEQILSRVRAISDSLGTKKIGVNGAADFSDTALEICARLGSLANAVLPKSANPYSELAGWIGGTRRDHPVETFTTNYDQLLEQALERARIPFFDGFSGAREPFFDAATVATDLLPSAWARVWKIHGSIGWERNNEGEIVRVSGSAKSDLIYPTHLKYEQTQKMPYSALVERLRKFLLTPDSLLLACGFSFADSHIAAVLDECLAANQATALLAIQYQNLPSESCARRIAQRRANASVYARDGAIINCVEGEWLLGDLPNPAWVAIRNTFWGKRDGPDEVFLLGDFKVFARYVALTRV